MIATECEHFEANLAALRSRQPDAAERLAGANVPAGVTPARGRDGSPTFRIPDGDATWHWLGRTSMPGVRAAALVDLLGSDGGNALVSPVGCGAEARELLDRGYAHSAVLVYDPDPADLRLALSLTDLSPFLRAGRLVILCGDDPCESIVAFFADHGGYEFPRKMLVPPYIDAPAIESLRAAMERAHTRIEQRRAKRVAACARTLADGSIAGGRVIAPPADTTHAVRSPAGRDPLRVVVLSIDPRPRTLESARAVRSAAAASGAQAAISLPDAPDRCHVLARIQTLVDHRAGAAILINGGWGPLLNHVPDTLPAVTWLLPGAAVVKGLTDGFSRRHVVFAATAAIADAAVDAGVPRDRVRRLEIGCDDSTFKPVHVPDNARFDVACVADAADLAAEACGIELTTQRILWRHIREQADHRLDAPATVVLAAAERTSHVTLTDENDREQFLNLIRARLLPTLVHAAAVDMLLDAGIDVRIVGTGWEHTTVPADHVRPMPDTPSGRNAVFNAARIVVFPRFDGHVVSMSLEAALSGACVVLPRPNDDDTGPGSRLRDALDSMPTFDTLRAMRKLVRHHLRDDDARDRACERVKSVIVRRHLMRHRVAVLLEALADAGGTA